MPCDGSAVGHSRDLIDILQALLTPIVAFLGISIAFAQWWVARNKFRLDLFDRRWAIYVATREMIGALIRQGAASSQDQQAFLQGVRGAKWLFDSNVSNYLDKELWPRVCYLEAHNSMLEGHVPEAERQAAAAGRRDIMLWVVNQDSFIDELFGRFLQMDVSFIGVLRGAWKGLCRLGARH